MDKYVIAPYQELTIGTKYPDNYALRIYNRRAQHPKLATCHYVIRFIDDGKRELERPTTKSGAFGPPPYFATQNRDDRLRNASTKGIGEGATHHPACVTLRRCPPPYSAKPNRDDRLRNSLTYQIQSAQSAPKLATCHFQLATYKKSRLLAAQKIIFKCVCSEALFRINLFCSEK